MAEALLKESLKHKDNHIISSAGLGALVGHNPDETAIKLMQEKGIDISDYQATQINQRLIKEADLILVMESKHKEVIESKDPSSKGKVFRLGEWAKFDIADPYKKERKVFEESLALIETGVSDWVKKI
jgi:protein-tyrosine phosphatase